MTGVTMVKYGQHSDTKKALDGFARELALLNDVAGIEHDILDAKTIVRLAAVSMDSMLRHIKL